MTAARRPVADLAARQAVWARFLDEPAFEVALRADPARVASEAGVPVATAEALARIPPHRVAAFRASQAHKSELRQKMAGSGVSK